jgi:hypothetical protein
MCLHTTTYHLASQVYILLYVSACYYTHTTICVLILLYTYYYICVLILLYTTIYMSSYYYILQSLAGVHTTICVLILLYSAIYIYVRILLFAGVYMHTLRALRVYIVARVYISYYISVLFRFSRRLSSCTNTFGQALCVCVCVCVCVSVCVCVCVCVVCLLLYVCPIRPHTAIYVSSCYCILMLLYMCPQRLCRGVRCSWPWILEATSSLTRGRCFFF